MRHPGPRLRTLINQIEANTLAPAEAKVRLNALTVNELRQLGREVVKVEGKTALVEVIRAEIAQRLRSHSSQIARSGVASETKDSRRCG
jgi:hypothetical protein